MPMRRHLSCLCMDVGLCPYCAGGLAIISLSPNSSPSASRGASVASSRSMPNHMVTKGPMPSRRACRNNGRWNKLNPRVFLGFVPAPTVGLWFRDVSQATVHFPPVAPSAGYKRPLVAGGHFPCCCLHCPLELHDSLLSAVLWLALVLRPSIFFRQRYIMFSPFLYI